MEKHFLQLRGSGSSHWAARRLSGCQARCDFRSGVPPSILPAARRALAQLAVCQAQPAVTGNTELGPAIQVACQSLGRTHGEKEQQLLQRLLDNYYERAQDILAITEAEATAISFPLALRAELFKLLKQQDGDPHHSQTMDDSTERSIGAVISAHSSKLGADVTCHDSTVTEQSGSSKTSVAPASSEADRSTISNNRSSTDSEGDEPCCSSSSTALDLMTLRAPPIRRSFGSEKKVRLTCRKLGPNYALTDRQMSDSIRKELQGFVQFCTTKFFGQRVAPVRACTAERYIEVLKGLLGWLHNTKGVPLDDLSLKTAMPSPKRDALILPYEYLQWLADVRGVSIKTELIGLRALSALAKYLYHHESKADSVDGGGLAYSDLEVVLELRKLTNKAVKEEKVAPHASDESLKWLDWPEYLQLVQDLKQECAGLYSSGHKRPRHMVAWSLQTYLIFAILSSVPDRQRTLRELQLGKTLVKEGGRWVIKHSASDYKTGKSYGERPPMVIASFIYPELEAFITTWRAELKPQHDYLFTRQNGQPFDSNKLAGVFRSAAFRLTGKKTNPHLVRDMIVTYLRGGNASERELEALAIYMGHSMKMQRDSYDRRTKAQKVEPAVELLETINRTAMRAKAAS